MARLLGTAGHVDHGKTTLIKALTGYDTDRLPEEKKRGLTIDLGFARMDLPGVGPVSVVDVPGHERFVHNMIVGALGVRVALLCVAADAGVMPQTREHLQILELLPVEALVVALTRADLVSADDVALVAEEVREVLGRFTGAEIVAVSAHAGTGLDELRNALARCYQAQEEASNRAWYLPIDRVFTVKGRGCVVTGTLMGGNVTAGIEGEIQPIGEKVRVRSVQSHDEDQATGEPGRRVALNLSGVEASEVERGMVVSHPGEAVSTELLDAQIRWAERPKHAARVRVSLGADEVMAKAFLNDHNEDVVQLRLERPAAAVKGQPLILRHYSPPDILGGGLVTVPRAQRRRKNARASQLAASDNPAETVRQLIVESEAGYSTAELVRTLGTDERSLSPVLDGLKNARVVMPVADQWMTPDQIKTLAKNLRQALQELHAEEPNVMHFPRERVTERAKFPLRGRAEQRLIGGLVKQGVLRQQGNRLGHPDATLNLTDRQQALLDRVTSLLKRDLVNVPKPHQLVEELQVPTQTVDAILALGVESEQLIRLDDQLHYPVNSIDQIEKQARAKLSGDFTASDFRDALNTTRKYAIPLLEHYDRMGVTVRHGDFRRFR